MRSLSANREVSHFREVSYTPACWSQLLLFCRHSSR